MSIKKKVSLILRGRMSEWGVTCNMSQAQIDAMREDGFQVDEILNTIPLWVASIGLARPWVFCQDVWAFRNPFSK